MKKQTTLKTRLSRIAVCGAILFTMGATANVVTSTVNNPIGIVNADTIGQRYNKDLEDTSQGKLRQSIDDAVSDNVYKGSDDRDYRGADLVKNGVTNDRAENLRREERERLFKDMNNEAEKQIEKSKDTIRENPDTDQKNVIDKGTKSNWIKDLQASPGMGTEVINSVLSDFKPDISSGQSILAPFQGVWGTVAGTFVIIAMWGLILTVTIDMAYLFFPAFQTIVTAHANSRESNGSSGGGFFKSKYDNLFVSREAIQALEEAEQNEGKKKSPYGIYFWKKGVAMFFFGILLLYLAQNEIWRFVGLFLDTLRGFGL